MTSKQYEELCRLFVSQEMQISIDQVWTLEMSSPWRPGLLPYRHQIDLFWKVEDQLSHYLCIANAKWRGQSKVDQGDVLLLQQVRQKVGANKAIIITNHAFTAGAQAAATDDHIGLHIVRPTFDFGSLHRADQRQIRAQLQALSEATPRLYAHDIIMKENPPPAASAAAPPRRAFTLDDPAAGFAPLSGSAANATPPPTPNYPTRQGGGPNFRTK
jgi:hypothetical protein